MSDGTAGSEYLGTNTLLVRLAQSQELHELPMKDGDAAIAAELVYSLWIRRRDASPWNRGYIEGVPAFFDHHIAFGVDEPANLPLDTFFRDGADGGYPRNWRVETYDRGHVPTTMSEREYDHERADFRLAIHRVSRMDGFLDGIAVTQNWIANLSQDSIRLAGAAAAAPSDIVDLLISTREDLGVGIKRLLEVVSQPI